MAKTTAQTPEVVTGKANLPVKAVNREVATLPVQEVPDYLKDVNSADGTEGMTREDMLMPRLALAQKMSHEVDPENAKFIEGLEVGDMFNSVTKQIYGPDAIEFVVLRRDVPRYVEFHPREQGGGIKDMNVPANDPRTQFTRGQDGKSVKPVATKFYDFIVMLLPSMEIIGLSFKSTGLKAARQLNTFLAMPFGGKKIPIYARKFKIHSDSDENQHGKFKIYVVNPSDIPSELSAVGANGDPIPGLVNQELFTFLKGYFDSYKDADVTIDTDITPDVDGPDRSTGEQPDQPGM